MPAAIRAVCSQFVVLCRQLGLFTRAVVAIDGSKFKAINNRDKNFTVAKVAKRIEQVEASIARYLAALDRAASLHTPVPTVNANRAMPRFVMPTSRGLPPVVTCLGTSPSQVAKSRPGANV